MSRQSANEIPSVEVVNMVERRRWPLAEKLRIVEESSRPGMSVSYVARYGITPSLLFRWGKLMSEGRQGSGSGGRSGHQRLRDSRAQKAVRELERLLGKKTMAVEIFKEGIKIVREKTDLAHAVALRGGFKVGCWNGEKVRVVFALDCCDRELRGQGDCAIRVLAGPSEQVYPDQKPGEQRYGRGFWRSEFVWFGGEV